MSMCIAQRDTDSYNIIVVHQTSWDTVSHLANTT